MEVCHTQAYDMINSQYTRVVSRSQRRLDPSKGFRLNARRFSVLVLRLRFVHFIRCFFCKFELSYEHARLGLLLLIRKLTSSLKRRGYKYPCSNTTGAATTSTFGAGFNRRRMVGVLEERMNLGRGNGRSSSSVPQSRDLSGSFYAEDTISDCLTYIKMSAVDTAVSSTGTRLRLP